MNQVGQLHFWGNHVTTCEISKIFSTNSEGCGMGRFYCTFESQRRGYASCGWGKVCVCVGGHERIEEKPFCSNIKNTEM